MNKPDSERLADCETQTDRVQQGGVSLVDLWLTLARHRLLIVVPVIIATIGAAGAAWLAQPYFESRTVLALGEVGQEKFLERPDLLVERLKQAYRINDPDYDPKLPYMSGATVDKNASKQVMTLRAVGTSPNEAKEFLEKVVSDLLAAHQRRYDEAFLTHREHLSMLELQIADVRRQEASLGEHVEQLKLSNPAQAALVAIERARLVALEPSLLETRARLRLGLMPPQSEQTRVLLPPTLPERAVRPRRLLYIIVGVSLGLLFGVFAAFAREFVEKVRQKTLAGRNTHN